MNTLKDYPMYQIFPTGEIFSKYRNKVLKPDQCKKGYQRVSLTDLSGKICRKLVHRLVAEHFIENLNNLPFINHIDNDPSNNDVSNLEWCTHSENMVHSHKQQRCSNLIASEKAKEVTIARTIENFKQLLGSRYISYEIKNDRGHIKFTCSECYSVLTCRTDSSIFKTGAICKSCSNKMKI
jgi:hypothetical protein